MTRLKTILALSLLSIILLAAPVFAAESILPEAGTTAQCKEYFDNDVGNLQEIYKTADDDIKSIILGCAVKTGKAKFWMLPFFIQNILEFVIGLSGLIAVLMIVVGAYYYIAGGISDDKEKGKTIIKYALSGIILISISWFLVNLLLRVLTS